MSWLIVKYLITALIIVAISEAAKHSDKLGGFIAALPMVTLLTLIWMYVEKQPQEKIANHAYYTFLYVLPTLPMFYVYPTLLEKLGFWGALAASILLTCVCFGLFAFGLKRFGIALL